MPATKSTSQDANTAWELTLPGERQISQLAGAVSVDRDEWTQPKSLPDSTGQLNWLPAGEAMKPQPEPRYLNAEASHSTTSRIPHGLAHRAAVVKRAVRAATAEATSETDRLLPAEPGQNSPAPLPLVSPRQARPLHANPSAPMNSEDPSILSRSVASGSQSPVQLSAAWQDAQAAESDLPEDVFDDVLDDILPGENSQELPELESTEDLPSRGSGARGSGRVPLPNAAPAPTTVPDEAAADELEFPFDEPELPASEDAMEDVFGEDRLPESQDEASSPPGIQPPIGQGTTGPAESDSGLPPQGRAAPTVNPRTPPEVPSQRGQFEPNVPSPSDRPSMEPPARDEREPGRIQLGPDGSRVERVPAPPNPSGIRPLTPDELLDFNGRDCAAEAMALESAWNEIRNLSIQSISLDISPRLKPNESVEEAEASRLETIQRIPSRTWHDTRGNVLATGKLRNYTNGIVIVEEPNGTLKELSWYELGNADLCFVSSWWELPTEFSPSTREYEPRDWTMMTFTWTASALCHKPLYFEEVQLERYGHTAGPIKQTVLSGAHFFGNIFFLPYHVGLNPPNECQYTLGYYRPGNCAPWLLPAIPLDARAARMQVGAVVGGLLWIP